jgi:hypothetical protein
MTIMTMTAEAEAMKEAWNSILGNKEKFPKKLNVFGGGGGHCTRSRRSVSCNFYNLSYCK